MIGAVALLAGCMSTPQIEGGRGTPSFAALQQMCDQAPVDYGDYAQGVFAATFDAFVAQRRRGLSHEQFCAFQAGLAQQHAALGTSGDRDARNRWVAYLNDQRAAAVHWRAMVDPTLRGG